MIRLTLAALVALSPLAVAAHEGVHIEDAYIRSANPKSAAAFMRLDNHASTPCTLRGASSTAAERVELHGHQEVDGVMKMLQIPPIEIPANGSHMLMRGGDHVMLLGLVEPLKDGDSVKISFDFDCGPGEAEITVDNQRQPDQADGSMQKH